jgi:hypothetical protein
MLTINKWLNNQGKTLTGLPLFRLSWSPEQFEHRKGTFDEFTKSGLFLRQFVGVKLVPKYPYLEDRWVLEKYTEPDYLTLQELPDIKFTYEPFWVFEDKNRNYLAPTLKAVEFIVNWSRKDIKSTPTERKQVLEDARQAEINRCYDELDTNALLSQLHWGEAILNPWGNHRRTNDTSK